MIIVVCTRCSECGGDQAVGVFSRMPSKRKIKEIEDTLGGMWCITHRVYKIKGYGIADRVQVCLYCEKIILDPKDHIVCAARCDDSTPKG